MTHINRSLRALPHFLIGALLAALVSNSALAQTTEPLLQQANLVYQGAFRVPNLNSSTGATFQYGGSATAYNPANNSLYMVGNAQHQLSAEISIPAPVNSANLTDLNIATVLQSFVDPTEGEIKLINPTNMNAQLIGGQLVYNGKLIVSAYSYYDAMGTQSTSHFTRPLSLSTTGQVTGPYAVGTQYPGYVSGYMTIIPSEWQSAFGGPALTGDCCLAITSIQSNGPAASVFDPAMLGKASPTPATPLVGYPHTIPLGPGYNTQNMLFNGTTIISGIVFPPGTSAVLFFGRIGTGPFCYGNGTNDPSLSGTVNSAGVPYCYDPAALTHGVHQYPYVYQVWAYNANDLLAVKNGTKAPYDIQPYTTWTFHLPFENPGDKHLLGGVGFDASHGLIYLSQMGEDNHNPIIHVFKVDGSISPPQPPGQVLAK
jgi:hypothetical protein